MAEIGRGEELAGRRVLVPGGTGAVGEGVVRAYLRGGAEVVVPTRSAARGEELRAALGPDGATGRLHVELRDTASFAGAERLAAAAVDRLGGIDDAVVPVGGWWAGGPLHGVGEDDWSAAFVGPATAHMALARAVLRRMSGRGAYQVVVGQSAETPVPGSGLVSMEQAAVLMLQRVLAAESPDRRVLALVLGPVRTRVVDGEPSWVSADLVGEVAARVSASPAVLSGTVRLGDAAEARAFLGA